jgi:hypothetical protein
LINNIYYYLIKLYSTVQRDVKEVVEIMVGLRPS